MSLRLPALILLASLLGAAAVQPATAHGDDPGRYGYFVPSSTSEPVVEVPVFGATVCIAAPGATGKVLFDIQDEGGASTGTLEVDDPQVHCERVDAAADLVLEESAGAEAVRVLVLQTEPTTMLTPGVKILAGAGDAVIVPRLAQDASLSVQTRDTFIDVAVFDGRTLERLDVATSIIQTADLMTGRSVDHEVWVVQMTGATDGQVRLLWEDDDWVRPAPTIGDILAVVVVGLFVTMFRGGKHKPGRPEQA